MQAVCWALVHTWLPNMIIPEYRAAAILILGLRSLIAACTVFIFDFDGDDKDGNATHQ